MITRLFKRSLPAQVPHNKKNVIKFEYAIFIRLYEQVKDQFCFDALEKKPQKYCSVKLLRPA